MTIHLMKRKNCQDLRQNLICIWRNSYHANQKQFSLIYYCFHALKIIQFFFSIWCNTFQIFEFLFVLNKKRHYRIRILSGSRSIQVHARNPHVFSAKSFYHAIITATINFRYDVMQIKKFFSPFLNTGETLNSVLLRHVFQTWLLVQRQ